MNFRSHPWCQSSQRHEIKNQRKVSSRFVQCDLGDRDSVKNEEMAWRYIWMILGKLRDFSKCRFFREWTKTPGGHPVRYRRSSVWQREALRSFSNVRSCTRWNIGWSHQKSPCCDFKWWKMAHVSPSSSPSPSPRLLMSPSQRCGRDIHANISNRSVQCDQPAT